jgi:hypothetical protein
VLTKERRFQDAFSVAAVDDDRIFDVAWISGIIPMLRQYSTQRLKSELSPAEVGATASSASHSPPPNNSGDYGC